MKAAKFFRKIFIAIIWPLVLYGLLSTSANLMSYFQTQTTSSHPAILISSNSRSPKSPETTSCQHKHSRCSISSTQLNNHINYNGERSIFGGKILHAHALQLFPTNHQVNNGIIELNSTNFNSELIQHEHPFPHIKLIEYYVSYCRFCSKFKLSYINLAKEIHEWRNVLRPSAIDVSVSSNSPIAQSWSVGTVPTLRIHPPPSPSLASKLDKQLSLWQQTLSFKDLQKFMFNEYNSSNLMLHSLSGVVQYLEKVSLLKSDLLRYIERYVSHMAQQPNDNNNENALFPPTWPNLRPVAETSLIELLRNHPRPELFLIIEGQPLTGTSVSDQSSSSSQSHEPSLGLQILMELSSSAPWKAVRYVVASDNIELIKDVIAQHKKAVASSDKSSNQIMEQVALLNNLLTNPAEGSPTIVLVHIDDSHHTTVNSVNTEALPLSSQKIPSQPASVPLMKIVSALDLGEITMSDYESSTNHHQNPNNGYLMSIRSKRDDPSTNDDIKLVSIKDRRKRSLFSVAGNAILDKMPNDRKVELLSKYIKQTYSEISDDREFVRAINSFDGLIDSKSINDDTKSPEDKQEKSSSSIINSRHKPLFLLLLILLLALLSGPLLYVVCLQVKTLRRARSRKQASETPRTGNNTIGRVSGLLMYCSLSTEADGPPSCGYKMNQIKLDSGTI